MNLGASESSVPVEEPQPREPRGLERTDMADVSLAFGPNDVLSGRNKLSFNHIGNKRFREVVGQSIDDYNSAQSRAEKYGIVETIMSHIAKSGGRFLKQVDDGSWEELEPDTVRQKIAHAIRDTTKKIEAKARKEKQRETASTQMARRVYSQPATVTPANHESGGSRQSAPPIQRFVQDLSKYIEQNPPRDPATHSPPGKGHKTDMLDLERPPLRPGMGMGMGMGMGAEPLGFRNELRHEPAEDIMRRNLGYGLRHSPPLGVDPSLNYHGQQVNRPASAPEPSQIYSQPFNRVGPVMGQLPTFGQQLPVNALGQGYRAAMAQMPRQHSMVGVGFRGEAMARASRQHSLPDLRRGVQRDVGGLGNHHPHLLQRGFESFSGPTPMMGHQQLAHQDQKEPPREREALPPNQDEEESLHQEESHQEEPHPLDYEGEDDESPVAQDDEFVAMIDGALGPFND